MQTWLNLDDEWLLLLLVFINTAQNTDHKLKKCLMSQLTVEKFYYLIFEHGVLMKQLQMH